MFLIFLIGSVGLQVWAWQSLTRRVQGGTLTRLQSIARYGGWAFLSVLFFVGVFAAMIGIEEWFQVAVIEERAALLAFPVFGLSVLGTAAFAVRCAFLRRRRSQ